MKRENRFFTFFGMNRYARVGTISFVLAVITLALLVTVNALMGLLPYRISNPDVTGDNTFRISGTTKDWLAGLDEDVTLYLISEGGKNAVDGDLYSFLCLYEEASERVRVRIVDPAAQTDFIGAFGGEWPSDKSVIVQSGRRYRIIEQTNLYYYYNAALEQKLTPEEYTAYLNTYLAGTDTSSVAYYYGQILYSYAGQTTAYFDGESRVTNAINFVTREDVPVVYTYLGAGCSTLELSLQSMLSDVCYDMRTVMLLSELPTDCNVLILHAPASDLNENEAMALRAYLASGGKLIVTTQTSGTEKAPRLAEILSEYGMSTVSGKHMLMEGSIKDVLSDSQTTYPYLFRAQVNSSHPLTSGFSKRFVACYSHAIALTEREGVTVTKLLHTSAEGYLYSYNEEQKKWENSEKKEEYVLGAVAEKDGSCVIWISCAESLSVSGNAFAGDSGNFHFLLQLMNRASGIENDSIAVESKVFESTAISVSVGQFMILGILLVLILPVTAVVIGVVVWQMRKKR